jgi:hypothetical protein
MPHRGCLPGDRPPPKAWISGSRQRRVGQQGPSINPAEPYQPCGAVWAGEPCAGCTRTTGMGNRSFMTSSTNTSIV